MREASNLREKLQMCTEYNYRELRKKSLAKATLFFFAGVYKNIWISTGHVVRCRQIK